MRKGDDKYVIAEEEESGMNLQFITKFLPYWPLLILFVLGSLVAAFIYLRYKTPVYEAAATIIIKDDKRGGDDSKIMQQLSLIDAQKDIDNEIEVLKSRAIMEGVVKRLFLYAPLSRKGKIKQSDAYLSSPVSVEAQNPDSVTEVEDIAISFDKTTQTVQLNKGDKYPINQFVKTPYGKLRFSPNRAFIPSIESEKELSFSLYDPKNVAVGLLLGLKVTSSKSAVLDLRYKDPIPQRAVAVLNNLISIYQEKSIIEKNVLARNTLSFINERLALLGNDLDSIEKSVQQYKTNNNAVDISAQGGTYLSTVSINDQELGKVGAQIAALNEVEKFVVGSNDQSGILPSTLGIADPALSSLTTKLYNSQLELEKLKKNVGENNPRVLALSDEINRMKPGVLDNIKMQKASLNATKQSLATTGNTYSSMLRAVPQKERKLLEISREQQIKSEQYNFLVQKKQEADLSLASALSNSKVVDSALASKFPVSPKRLLIFMMAIAGAFGLFVVTILAKESFSAKVKYRSEVEKMTSIPIIGEIAFEKTSSPLVIEKGTRSFVAEEFRKLRISLSFLGIDSTHKKILLTSSISGEGKSFVAANLAVSISLTGKKVILVDLDLNNPTLSKILQVNYENGVTEFLTGEKTAEQIINNIEGRENLSFISAGSLPESPSELLAGGKIKSLIDYLESNYDMVVIDTSPIVLVTDAYILSELCDATLYVIRHNYTPKMLVKRIDENNQINPINNPAIIFNGVKTRGVFKNNYGYGYDYVYGNKDRGTKSKKS